MIMRNPYPWHQFILHRMFALKLDFGSSGALVVESVKFPDDSVVSSAGFRGGMHSSDSLSRPIFDVSVHLPYGQAQDSPNNMKTTVAPIK